MGKRRSTKGRGRREEGRKKEKQAGRIEGWRKDGRPQGRKNGRKDDGRGRRRTEGRRMDDSAGHLRVARCRSTQAFPDGDRVATIGTDRTMAIWRVSSGVLLLRTQLPEAQRAVRVLVGGDRVVTGASLRIQDPALVACWRAHGMSPHRERDIVSLGRELWRHLELRFVTLASLGQDS